MLQVSLRPWYSVLLLAFLATTTVHGHPVRQDAGEANEIEARSPVSHFPLIIEGNH